MRTESDRYPVELTVPAVSEMMLVIRLTTAGAIARAGVTVDRVDEVKMAVEEGCRCLIDQFPTPDRLNLRFTRCPKGLDIDLAAVDEVRCGGRLEPSELEVMQCILSALADNVVFDTRDGRIDAVRMHIVTI